MIMGEAAGCASGLVAKRRTTSVAIATEMKSKLLSYGAVMKYPTTAIAVARLDSSAPQSASEDLDSGAGHSARSASISVRRGRPHGSLVTQARAAAKAPSDRTIPVERVVAD